MRALLDVNVCIALLDPNHVFHERAHTWWSANRKHGWARCPLTENGVVRIMSNPAYSKETRFPITELILHLTTFVSQTDHEFWPDRLSIRNSKVFDSHRMHSPAQLTDLYLLALAADRRGRLATFDKTIPTSAVKNAKPDNLVNI